MPGSDRLLLALSDCNLEVNQKRSDALYDKAPMPTVELTFMGVTEATAFIEAVKAYQVEQVPVEDVAAYERAAKASHSAQIKAGQARSKLPNVVRRIIDERLRDERDPA